MSKRRDTERCVVVQTTVAGKADARKLAGAIVKARQAACAQIFALQSVYWWKGKMDSAREYAIIFKTTRGLVKSLIREIRRRHSYELPEIVVTAIEDGLPAYLQWIGRETQCSGRKGHR